MPSTKKAARKAGAKKSGLYANIHAKQERIAHGSGEHMRKAGTKGAPSPDAFAKSDKTSTASKKAVGKTAAKKATAKKAVAKKSPAKKAAATKTAAKKVVAKKAASKSPAKKAAAKKTAAKKTSAKKAAKS